LLLGTDVAIGRTYLSDGVYCIGFTGLSALIHLNKEPGNSWPQQLTTTGHSGCRASYFPRQ